MTSGATIKRAGTYGYPVVVGLSAEERARVRAGKPVYVAEGNKLRVVVMRGRRYVPRATRREVQS